MVLTVPQLVSEGGNEAPERLRECKSGANPDWSGQQKIGQLAGLVEFEEADLPVRGLDALVDFSSHSDARV